MQNRLSCIALIFSLFTTIGALAQIRRELAPVDRRGFESDTTIAVGTPDTLDVGLEYNLYNYDITDGLCSRSVNKIWFDSHKRMWIGTNGGGVSIFDGHTFRNLNISDGLSRDIVWDFLEDDQGRIWIATDSGVSVYDGRSFDFIDAKRPGRRPVVMALKEDTKGRIWMGLAGGGFHIHDGNEVTYHNMILGDSLVQVRCFYEAKDGTMYMGTWGKGVLVFDGKDYSFFSFDDFKRSGIVNDIVIVNEDHDPTMWVATWEGLYKIQGGDTTLYTREDGLPANTILDLHPRGEEGMWIATGGGVVLWDDGVRQTLTSAEGLPDDPVKAICEDDWGNLWFGMYRRGLSKYIGDAFVHFTEAQGLPSGGISTVFEDSRGHIWMGFDGEGLVRFDGRNYLHYSEQQGFIWKYVVTIEEDSQGNIWIGCDRNQGLIKYDGINFEHYGKGRNSIHNDNIREIIRQDDALWVATAWQMDEIRGDSIYHHIRQNLSDHYFILDMMVDSENHFWMASHGGGAGRLVGDSVFLIKQEHGLPNSSVFAMEMDSHGNLWIAVNAAGVNILRNGYDEKPWSEWEWKRITTSEGLQTNKVNFILEDGYKNMWLGTDLGINKISLDGGDIFESDYGMDYYGLNQGFKGLTTLLSGAVEDRNGHIWMMSENRLSRFNSARDKRTKEPPFPMFTGIKINLKEVQWDTLVGADVTDVNPWNNLPERLSLPYEHNHVTLEFKAITHNMVGEVQYRWRLVGLYDTWSPWTDKQHATYSFLPAGEYTFELEARDADGNVSKPLSYSFEVRAPFWQEWWFRISVGAAILLILFGIFKWRTVALRRRQKVLENTVEERTSEVVRQKEEIEHQRNEILDSINYAKRIQEAILPPQGAVEAALPQSWILYKPKDIVAGDFYWMEKKGDEVLIAAADCTGHGVPGAMVSVVCSNALNAAVLEEGLTDPGEILDRVTEIVIERFEQQDENLGESSREEIKDGMDIALCRINKTTRKLAYAGANNPLWIIRSGSDEIKEIKANKQPVGKYTAHKPFQTHEEELHKGDSFYIFSDGFPDQFGGPKGKKFKASNFKQLLLSLVGKPMPEQRAAVNNKFEDWRGEIEQIDDVCVIGVRL